jgi:GTP-binding protein HflX
VAEVHDLIRQTSANLVVFDNELSGPQVRELEKGLECRVIDRSELILDLFARRARTNEARLQVELAQLQYTAPRLRGMWTHLSRQAGGAAGIGQRGPGEKQIEIDRRLVRNAIKKLEGELAAIAARRERRRERRAEAVFRVGLVGYTNAGKSTLLNTLTGAGTYAADALFATLDTRTRRWQVGGHDVVLSDTVGFVRDLPHHLVASFRATLEESLEADLLLHVIDASHPLAEVQVATVEEVLRSLDRDPLDAVRVLNKIDGVTDLSSLAALRDTRADVVEISALTGEGLDALEALVLRRWQADWVTVEVTARQAASRVRAVAFAEGDVDTEHMDDDGLWHATVHLPRRCLGLLGEAGGDVVLHA